VRPMKSTRLGVSQVGDTILHLLPGCEDGAGVGGGVVAVVGHRGGGRLDDGVVGGGQGGDFVDGVVDVGLEADLAAKRPCTLDPGIVSEGAE